MSGGAADLRFFLRDDPRDEAQRRPRPLPASREQDNPRDEARRADTHERFFPFPCRFPFHPRTIHRPAARPALPHACNLATV